MVGRVALREFLTRIPDFEVDHERITWAPGNYVRRPLSVPLTVVDRGRA
jgi:cytochrome P450 family 130